jgi:3-oxoacyl-[acyl-carrier protein] reductase
VSFCGRSAESVELAAAELGELATGTVVDVSDHEGLTAWVAASAEQHGGLDIVIPNASALGGPPDSPDKWRRVFETDVLSTAALVDAATPHLTASGQEASCNSARSPPSNTTATPLARVATAR